MEGFWPIGRQAWWMSTLPDQLRLESDRVVLRDWCDGDALALEPACGEWDVCAFTSVPWSYSEAGALEWIERQRRKRAAGTVLALAIQGREDPHALGNVNLAGLGDGGREAEIGYWLVPEARGRGLAAAAVSLLAEWGFEELGLERIEFAILPENIASQRVAERLGASPEGIRERSHQAEGRAWDMTIWSLTR
ncbi:MAG: GNAT family N-acetyltransferase [Actinobacteria bacterium]|nr:GNAT family N-acetyltransferase [Actinomycetota bacterium]